jgi:hypothetical protein
MTTDQLLIAFLIETYHLENEWLPKKIISVNFRGNTMEITWGYNFCFQNTKAIDLLDYITWVFNYKGVKNEQE